MTWDTHEIIPRTVLYEHVEGDPNRIFGYGGEGAAPPATPRKYFSWGAREKSGHFFNFISSFEILKNMFIL